MLPLSPLSASSAFAKLFKRSRGSVIAMIHVKPLPGTPRSSRAVSELVEHARQEALIYKAAAVDGVLVENMHDTPYVTPSGLGPEVTAAMTAVCAAVKQVLRDTPVGCQVLAGGNKEALAVAAATGLDFIRAEGYVFGHVADEGYTNACAGELLRYRRSIGADNVQVWADIKKKHSSHAITSDVTVAETARAAEFFMASAVIITGSSTGAEAGAAQLTEVSAAVPGMPVVIGSGVTAGNLHEYIGAAALIVGSHFKQNGHWSGELSSSRVEHFMEQARTLRQHTN